MMTDITNDPVFEPLTEKEQLAFVFQQIGKVRRAVIALERMAKQYNALTEEEMEFVRDSVLAIDLLQQKIREKLGKVIKLAKEDLKTDTEVEV